MKKLTISYNFLFIVLMSMPLALCSCNSGDEPQQGFETIIIDLEGSQVITTDTSFIVDSFTFRSEGAQTTPSNFTNQGVDLTPGMIELDLASVVGISRITISMFNNSDPTISLLNNGNLVLEINNDFDAGLTDASINVEDVTFDALRIFSFEATILSITLE
ncbi:MAG: hypothetical protein Mars2KO_44420 [Maribacter sp.]